MSRYIRSEILVDEIRIYLQRAETGKLHARSMPLFVERSAKCIGAVLARGLVNDIFEFLQIHSNIISISRMSFTEVLGESAAVPQDTETTGHCTGDHDVEGAGR